MPRPWRIRFTGAKYHVTVRGNGRQQVFFDDDYYLRFLEQLALALVQDEVILYAYAILPNHYHLFIETPLGNIQRFMQRLNTAYSMYFRYKHGHPGHCFQGRYGAKLVSGDDYIWRVLRYIHLNPVKTALYDGKSLTAKRKALNMYQWSSYPGYVGLRPESDMIDYRWLKMTHRKTKKGMHRAYQAYVESMLGAEDTALGEAQEASRYALGDPRFVKDMEETLKEAKRSVAVDGDIHWPDEPDVPVERVLAVVSKVCKVSPEDLHSRARGHIVHKRLAIELACQHSGLSQRELTTLFGYTNESSISKQRQTLARQLTKDKQVARRLAKAKVMILDSSFQV